MEKLSFDILANIRNINSKYQSLCSVVMKNICAKFSYVKKLALYYWSTGKFITSSSKE